MSPQSVDMILERLGEIHGEVVYARSEAAAAKAEAARASELAGQAVAETKKTNGRVTQLELWKAELRGAFRAVGWVPPLITALAGGSIGAVIMLIAQH